MSLKPELQAYAYVDEEGRLVLPPEVAARHGLRPGARLRIEGDSSFAALNGAKSLHLRRSITHLAKIYIEPTNRCNLECRTCIRNVWDEPLGDMTGDTFDRIIQGLGHFSPCPTVFFGGFGEPLAHPDIIEMVARAKSLDAPVELITNGTLLTPDISCRLIEAGLDGLWVSLDGARPESYGDVRLGAALPQVIANLTAFRDARRTARQPAPQIGIAFVAMKRNITDLPAVLYLGGRLGAVRFLVSNVLPYTGEMCNEVLYARALSDIVYMPSAWKPHVSLPKIDVDKRTCEPLYRLMRGGQAVNLAGVNFHEANNRCPFIEGGAAAIGWDGSFSPCLPLLHSHLSFLDGRERFSQRYVIGNVAEWNLGDLWNAPDHLAFRQRVQTFDFSPCTLCGGCRLSETNEEDCFGNTFPTCGGCLWAQRVIRCP